MARNDSHRGGAVRFAISTAVVALALSIVAAVLPNAIAAEAATENPVSFHSQLGAEAVPGRIAPAEATLAMTFAKRARTETFIAPVVVPKPTVRRSTGTTTSSSSASTASSTGTPVAEAPADETAQAQSILAGLIGQYPILAGTTVSFGDARGAQAIAYYKSGRIVISPTHTASLSRILNHEVWHIIDWRDNNVIDWGENVPPK